MNVLKDRYFHNRETGKEFMMFIVKIFRFRTWQIEQKGAIIKLLNYPIDKDPATLTDKI